MLLRRFPLLALRARGSSFLQLFLHFIQHSFVLWLSLFLSFSPALAAPISFSPNGISNSGAVKTEVSLKSLGDIATKNGSASINGRVITIKASPEFVDAPHTVLIGSVLRSEANLSSTPPSVTGIALFLMGDWMEQIDDPSTADIVFRSNGQVQGRILGLENDSISLKKADGTQEKIPLNAILYLRSPRVFVFRIDIASKAPLEKDSVFQADAISTTFRPTAAARIMSGSIIKKPEQAQDATATGALSGAKPGTPNAFFEDEDQPMMQPSIFGKPGRQRMTLPPGLLD